MDRMSVRHFTAVEPEAVREISRGGGIAAAGGAKRQFERENTDMWGQE